MVFLAGNLGVSGILAGFVCEKVLFVYFLGFDSFCSVCLGVWVFLCGEGRDMCEKY